MGKEDLIFIVVGKDPQLAPNMNMNETNEIISDKFPDQEQPGKITIGARPGVHQ